MPAGVGEQVLDDALNLGRVDPGDHRLGQHLQLPAAAQPPLLGDPGDEGGEVGGVLRGQARPGPLEGEADADHRGQRGAQLVGDGVQEGVLHLVEGPQLPGRLPLALQRLPFPLECLAQRLLGLLLLGDVDVVALPVVGLAIPRPPAATPGSPWPARPFLRHIRLTALDRSGYSMVLLS
jgi:hypothetical protein